MGPILAACGLLACAGMLWAESRRLPVQNVVALGVLAPLLAMAIDLALGRVFPGTGPAWDSVAWGGWALLAGRALARLPGPGPQHLFVRTVLATLFLTTSVHWPASPSAGAQLQALALRLASQPFALLILFPWWIAKPLAPRSIPTGFNVAAPAALAVHALLDLAANGLPGMIPRGIAAVAVSAWVYRLGR